MRAGRIMPVALLFLLLALGLARVLKQNRTPAQPPQLISSSVQAATTQQPEPDDRPTQIRTSEVSCAFTGRARAEAQAESQQGARLTSQGWAISQARQAATLVFNPVAVTLDSPSPFLALSAAWSAVSADDARLAVSVRASPDGSAWGEWQPSSLDGDPHTHSGLFFLPKESRFIQYRVEMARDPGGISPVISSIRFRFISPGATPKSMSDRMRNQPRFEGRPVTRGHQTAAAGGSFPKPSVVSRIAWGCPDGDQQHRGAPSYTTVTHLIVHHTATGNDVTDWPAAVRSIWNFHVFTNGWSDIGYNYLIDPDGLIYEGRAGGDNVLGAHFSCANSDTMGTAMLGTFTSVVPTVQALTSLKYMLSWKSDQRGIDPLGVTYHGGTQLNLQNVSGHRDANASTSPTACPGTECPGNSLYPLLPGIRSEVKAFVDPADDFSLAADPPVRSVPAGNATSFAISTATVKGNQQTVRLEVSGLPAGVTASINPPTVTSGNAATLLLNVGATATGGTYPVTITATGSTIRARQISLSVTGTITTVSAASYKGEAMAREAIAAAFGAGLATTTQIATTLPLPTQLVGVTVKVTDSLNVERPAPLFFVSTGQINYQIPPGTATGTATVAVTNGSATVASGTIRIADVAPSLFSADASGGGLAAALALRVRPDNTQSYEPVAQFDQAQNRFVARPIDLGANTDQVFLILFGTGLRHRSSPDAVTVRIGNTDLQVDYAGEQGGYAGLDQVNVRLPQSLRGKGEVDLELVIDGRAANVVRLSIQ
ncbi:MAG TPA: N-acetylmuramoyl-L-alanine amidase [Blastocatellia bacterium]|nr:N-acetylmuramoyl-L-alanine amidase [Blastocatellia bacterium]